MTSNVNRAIYEAVDEAVYWTMRHAVSNVVFMTVDGAVSGVVYNAVNRAVSGAVHGTARNDPPHPALNDFLTPNQVAS